MNVLLEGFVFFVLCLVTASSEGEFEKLAEIERNQVAELPRYVVFPGLDAEDEEVAEWTTGFASPFNVFFGPKPYILGWVGEAPFGPVGEEEEEDIEGEEGDLEEEEIEEEEEVEVEGEGEEADYDYEKLQKN